MLFSCSKGQPHPQFGSLRVLIQLTMWVSPRGAGRKREQSVMKPPSPRDMAAVVTHEVVMEMNKGRSHIPLFRGGRYDLRWDAEQLSEGWREKSCNIKSTLTADVSNWVLLQYDVWSMTTKIGITGDSGCLPAWYSAAPQTDSRTT